MDEILRDSPDHLLDVIAKVFRALLYNMNMPKQEAEAAVSMIKERKMGRLFENVTMDIQEERRKNAQIREQAMQAMQEAAKARQEAEQIKQEAVKACQEAVQAQKEMEQAWQKTAEVEQRAKEEMDAASRSFAIYRSANRLLRMGRTEEAVREQPMAEFSLTRAQADAEIREVLEG